MITMASHNDILEFEKYVCDSASFFRNGKLTKKIRLISHLDADGIASAAIIIKMLARMGIDYELSTVPQLNEKFMFALRSENYSNYIFTDVGSGQLTDIISHFHEKSMAVLIIDHHRIKGDTSLEYSQSLLKKNICHVNPHIFGIDGATEISSSGVAFMFAKAVDPANADLAHLAIIGAIGDVQEKKGFRELNQKILDMAVENKVLSLRKAINFFGLQTKSIGRMIESSSNLYIPSITGDRIKTNAFLNSLGIDPNKRYYELTDDERDRLVERIIKFRKQYFIDKPEDIYASEYLIEGEKDGSVFRDVREFSTLLNACGRLNRPDLGIGSCLMDEKLRAEALENLREYKSEIVNALTWYDTNKEEGFVDFGKRYVIVNAKDNISPTIIGTLASILSKTKLVESNKYVLTMARNEDNTTKISLRYSGKVPDKNLRDVLNGIIDKIGGESGGHDFAAGAIIEQKIEDEFIEHFKRLFE